MNFLLSELKDPDVRRSKSARKIAAYVVENAPGVIDMSIAHLAAEVGVSEPTVNRFCTGLGLKGFPDFKLRLAGELGRQNFSVFPDIAADDSCGSMVAKVFEAAHACLNSTMNCLDIAMIDEVVQRLSVARSIVICGQGASSSVALDAQHKFLRFSVPVIAHLDNLNQRMAASGLRSDDCVICISYTGRTLPIVEVAGLARKSGATVIGITAGKSTLASACDYVLEVESSDNTDLYTPMSSRIAQLAIIDVLTTRLAVYQPESHAEQLKSMKQSLVATRIPPGS
jgi:RpiR family transcriptional regulator, carbohydrate utilization regulator